MKKDIQIKFRAKQMMKFYHGLLNIFSEITFDHSPFMHMTNTRIFF